MNSEVKVRIAGLLSDARNKIIQNMASASITTTGRTAKSLSVVEYDGGVKLIGDGSGAPPPTLEVGRAGGKVPTGFRHIIEQWSRDKGLTFENDRERRTFSYFVARRIAEEGTLRHKNPRRDIYTPVMDELRTRMPTAIREGTLEYIAGTLRTKFAEFGRAVYSAIDNLIKKLK